MYGNVAICGSSFMRHRQVVRTRSRAVTAEQIHHLLVPSLNCLDNQLRTGLLHVQQLLCCTKHACSFQRHLPVSVHKS